MIIPRFIEGFSPEKKWSNFPLAKDGIGDQFLPLSPELQNPLPVSPDWPGEGVAAHVMITSGGRSIDTQLKQVLGEGLVAPRNYAILSTRAEMGWGGKQDTAVLVCRAPCRWTREFTPVDKTEYHPYVEGMIGLSIEQAIDIAPHGAEYNLEYCSDRRRRAIMAIGVLAYVPPAHLLGVLRLKGGNHHELSDYQSLTVHLAEEYAQGKIEETQVGPALAASWMKAVDITVRTQGNNPESLFKAIASAYTAAKLLAVTQEAYRKDGPQVLEKFRPSYPLTKQIHELALNGFRG